MVGFKTFLQFLNIWQIYVAKHRNRAFLKNLGRLEENEGKWGIWGDFWSIKGEKAVLAHTLYIIYRYKALNFSAAEKIYRRCKRKLSLKWQLFIKGARKNVPKGKVFNAFELRRFPKGWILQKTSILEMLSKPWSSYLDSSPNQLIDKFVHYRIYFI